MNCHFNPWEESAVTTRFLIRQPVDLKWQFLHFHV